MEKKPSFDKELQKREILMKDEQTNGWFYEDHITAIVNRARKEGAFDNLEGIGKPLNIDEDLVYNPEKRLHKVMKDNNILPSWVKLGKEIDVLKEELTTYTVEYNIKKTVETINQKVFQHNLSCPPTAQRMKVKLEDVLKK
jgi:ribosomal protein L39E